VFLERLWSLFRQHHGVFSWSFAKKTIFWVTQWHPKSLHTHRCKISKSTLNHSASLIPEVKNALNTPLAYDVYSNRRNFKWNIGSEGKWNFPSRYIDDSTSIWKFPAYVKIMPKYTDWHPQWNIAWFVATWQRSPRNLLAINWLLKPRYGILTDRLALPRSRNKSTCLHSGSMFLLDTARRTAATAL
jgi:hypothetical protein